MNYEKKSTGSEVLHFVGAAMAPDLPLDDLLLAVGKDRAIEIPAKLPVSPEIENPVTFEYLMDDFF